MHIQQASYPNKGNLYRLITHLCRCNKALGSANGSTEITKLFYNKYRSLYSSVPTDDNELREIHDVINSRLSTYTHKTVTPAIIKQCIHKLKPGKDNGDGF